MPEEIRKLEDSLGDQYLCNFSVFQSLLDHWALDQLFPIMPITRLNERPTREATLVDITCDSDGQVNKFIDFRDVRDTLPLHQLNTNGNGQPEPYYLGFFLMGAYQDIMGDLHNLFGRVNEVHVFLEPDEPAGYYIEEIIEGNTIVQVARCRAIRRKRTETPDEGANGRRHQIRPHETVRSHAPAGRLRARVEGLHLLEFLNSDGKEGEWQLAVSRFVGGEVTSRCAETSLRWLLQSNQDTAWKFIRLQIPSPIFYPPFLLKWTTLRHPIPDCSARCGHLARGLSALFWGLPASLVICVGNRTADWLKPWGFIPALAATALLLYGLWQMGDFQKQERPWRNALDRAKLPGLVNFGLCPFLYWHNRMPASRFSTPRSSCSCCRRMLFLFNLNVVLKQLGAMLPDETLRHETRQFTALNRWLLAALLLFGIAYVVLLRDPRLPVAFGAIFVWLQDFGFWVLTFFALLPLAMTMALIWKTKEVILDSVFGAK